MRLLTIQALAEAKVLGDRVSAAQTAADGALEQLSSALLAKRDQNSDQWADLCYVLASAVRQCSSAADAQRAWWDGRDFNV